MALIKCPECKKKISDQCGKCPSCGYPIEINNQNIETNVSNESSSDNVINKEIESSAPFKKAINKKCIGIICSVLLVLIILGAVVGYFALRPRMNAINKFERQVSVVEDKNKQLDSAIKLSENLLKENHPILNNKLISELEMAISDAKASKETNFKIPDSIEEITMRTEELKKIDYSVVLSKLTEKHENFVIDSRRYQLVDNPTEEYVIQCLKNVPRIVNISAVTEDNDPNGNLNKPGGYTATVFFAVDYVDLEEGKTLIEQGTDAGGSIEVYASVEDAIKRRDYLATFDGGLFASGTHTVVGTVLVRTSDEQTASQQKTLESEVITALTYLPDIDANNLNQPENSTQVVTTAFKETMDSHAEFIDSYVAYLIKSINSTDLTIKEDYEVYVRRYYETMEQIDSINTNDLSVADCEYYNEVNSKISKKLKELEDYGINPNQPTKADKYPQFKSLKVGDCVKFGQYIQEYAMGMKDIEWLVLEVQKDKALLISKFVLDCGMFNELEDETNWESCTLRGWLNNTFLESAFSEDEKSMILKSFVPASTDPNNDTNCSNSTNDKIFLLSVEEVSAYFNSPHEMIATPTDYAKFNGIIYSESTNTANWWLRTPGNFDKNLPYYSSYIISENGECEAVWTMSSITGIRPAMWIDLKDFS